MVTANDVQVGTIKEQAEEIAEVMERHDVFGRCGTDYAFYEKHDFVSMVTRHAVEDRGALELTYRNSNVRVIINTQVVKGVASIKSITAFNHPNPNPSIYFEELEEDVQAVIS